MVLRKEHLRRLLLYKDNSLLKVVTGLRRSGKSTLLKLLKNHLIECGTPSDHIIEVNFELMEFDEVKSYKELHAMLRARITDDKKHYILLDEIQMVSGWEKAINSLNIESDIDVDIYITGSNAHLLSSDISTLLSGRYVEIPMLPLSFREFLQFEHLEGKTEEQKFYSYLKYGSLPAVPALNQNDETIFPFLLGVYNTVIVKDIIERTKSRDVVLLEKLVRYVITNTGSLISPNKISGFLSAQGKGENYKSTTISTYLDVLEKAYIVYRADRYDIKGKEQLKTLSKYYVSDSGIRNAIMGYSGGDIGHILETVVYFELIRRGYKVNVGKWYSEEVDFLCQKADRIEYYQVTYSLMDESVKKRELASLKAIPDQYPKTILSMDKMFFKGSEGIAFKNIIDFLLEE